MHFLSQSDIGNYNLLGKLGTIRSFTHIDALTISFTKAVDSSHIIIQKFHPCASKYGDILMHLCIQLGPMVW